MTMGTPQRVNASHVLRRGLDLPISGVPDCGLVTEVRCGRVAALGADYPGLRPRLRVAEGDRVAHGQLLAECARNPALRVAAPGSGRVVAIHLEARRQLGSVVLQLDGEARGYDFASYRGGLPRRLADREVRDLLIESGCWSALRTRPFGRVPAPGESPAAIFVTALNTEPLAPPVERELEGQQDALCLGLEVLLRLTPGPVWLCRRPGAVVEVPDDPRIRVAEFDGPHPAGLPGTHIHLLAPVGRRRRVWQLHAREAAAIGRVFSSGRLPPSQRVALAGPWVRRPRLLSVPPGAAMEDLVAGELVEGGHRVISGSVLSGRNAVGPTAGYLGRFHRQVTVLPEGGRPGLPAWLKPGSGVFSVTGAFVSRFLPRRRFDFDTSAHGAARPMVPLEAFESVMPLDILPVPLLRALAARDAQRAVELGCLELLEEDLALCSFVDPGKTDWGRALREVLSLVEGEG